MIFLNVFVIKDVIYTFLKLKHWTEFNQNEFQFCKQEILNVEFLNDLKTLET